jgi:hypothetical protein
MNIKPLQLTPETEAPLPPGDGRRGSVVDRRLGLEKRTGLEHLRGPGRRRTDFTRSAEEGQMTNEQFLFLMAIDAFKRVNKKTFPSWTEVLEVMRKLGYRKTMASELTLTSAEDWTEPANSPSLPPTAPKDDFNVDQATD